jgi:hypothetical protein
MIEHNNALQDDALVGAPFCVWQHHFTQPSTPTKTYLSLAL